jgi:hypothetical protein
MAPLRPALRIPLLLSAILITACSNSSPTEAGSDSVTVVSIQPPSGTTLQAGSQVTFSATIDYHLFSALSGSIVMVVEDQNYKNLSTTVPQPRASVAGGRGTRTLSDQIVVPSAYVSTVHVLFPLLPEGNTNTRTVAAVSYPVGPAASLVQAQEAPSTVPGD